MQRRQNSKKGLTMIELVVAFALSAIFFTALLTVIAPIYRTYQRTRAFADAELVAGNVLDTLRTTAGNAKTLTTDGSTISVGTRLTYGVPGDEYGYLQYTVTDGEVSETKDVFDEKVYDGNEIKLAATELAENVLDVTVYVRTPSGATTSVSGVLSTVYRYVSGSSTGPNITPNPTPRPTAVPKPTAAPTDDPGGGGGGTPPSRRKAAELEQSISAYILDYLINPLHWFAAPKTMFEAYRADHSGFPGTENIHQLLEPGTLNKLLKDTTLSAEKRALYELLKQNNSAYMSAYLPDMFLSSTTVPIVYMTLDSVGAYTDPGDGRCPYGNALFIYFNDTWYIRNPDTAISGGDWGTLFDRKNATQIQQFLTGSQTYFTMLSAIAG